MRWRKTAVHKVSDGLPQSNGIKDRVCRQREVCVFIAENIENHDVRTCARAKIVIENFELL